MAVPYLFFRGGPQECQSTIRPMHFSPRRFGPQTRAATLLWLIGRAFPEWTGLSPRTRAARLATDNGGDKGIPVHGLIGKVREEDLCSLFEFLRAEIPQGGVLRLVGAFIWIEES